jgi:hypothetical protein
VVGAVLGVSASGPLQSTPAQNQAGLPPVMWTCQTRQTSSKINRARAPFEDMPGMKHDMVPVRLTAVLSCPVHTVVAR